MKNKTTYIYDKPIIEGIFLSRPNRFLAEIQIGHEVSMAHIKNTGRLRELLIPGRRCWLQVSNNSKRKTKYDLISIEKGDEIINLDSQVPNKIIHRAFLNNLIKGWESPNNIQREVKVGGSRLDFKVEKGDKDLFVEVKGVNLLLEKGQAAFPDAVTSRGRRHLLDLLDLRQQGYNSMIIFLIQRSEVLSFRPHWERDPLFSETFYYVVEEGVEARAYNCISGYNYISLDKQVKIIGI